MKKLISFLLALCIGVSLCMQVMAAYESGYSIVFVTGIGQNWMRLQNSDGTYRANLKSDPKTYNRFWKEQDPIEYNLFYPDSNGFRVPCNAAALVRSAGQLLSSVFFDRNLLQKRDLRKVAETVFHYHLLDENGRLPSDVADFARNYPVSEYNEADKDNFYSCVPCQSVLGNIGEEDLFCFYHSAFSDVLSDADDLDTFIENVVLPGRRNKKVVLVPMSMGAAVVSAYLAKYGEKRQVDRVVSIVGAWNGSDLVADLIEGRYDPDAPQMLYSTLLPKMIKEPYGSLVGILLHAVPKAVLREMLDTVLQSIVETLVLPIPSMLALIPAERYPAIEQQYLSDSRYARVREAAHEYYEIQRTFPQRMHELEKNGMEFYFISGYNLRFGGADDEYWYFRFMESARKTNGDEIIQISSTAPGAEFAPVGSTLGRDGAYVSQDGSVDLSACVAPERTWCFEGQRHQLDYNNTALRLAMEIATGKVKDVQSSADRYPQFNKARNVRALLRGDNTLLVRLQRVIDTLRNESGREADISRAQQALDDCNAMLERTINDPQTDNAVIERAERLLAELEPKAPEAESEPQPLKERIKDKLEQMILEYLSRKLPVLHEKLYAKYGTGGWRER